MNSRIISLFNNISIQKSIYQNVIYQIETKNNSFVQKINILPLEKKKFKSVHLKKTFKKLKEEKEYKKDKKKHKEKEEFKEYEENKEEKNYKEQKEYKEQKIITTKALTTNFYCINNNLIHLEKYPLTVAVCISLFENFTLLNDEDKEDFINRLNKKMALELDSLQLYEKLNYKYKKFKKSDLQNYLFFYTDYQVPHSYYYIYLADYFNINILISYKNILNSINNYENNRFSLIIYKQKIKNNIFKYYIKKPFLLNNECISKMNINTNTNNKYNKMKLNELQKIAIELNINIKKMGKNKLINKKKIELIEEIISKKI